MYENTLLGALADSVSEVIELDPDQIDPPPRIWHQATDRFHQRHRQEGWTISSSSWMWTGFFRWMKCPRFETEDIPSSGAEPASPNGD